MYATPFETCRKPTGFAAGRASLPRLAALGLVAWALLGAAVASADITLSSNVTSRNEKDGAVTVTITANSNRASIYDRTVTVDVGSQSDTATEGTDYNTVSSFSITIAPFTPGGGNNYSGTGTFTLTPKQDNLVEGNETIKIDGSNPDETVHSTTITLTDDEIGLSTSPTSVDERSAARTVTVTASGSQMTTARTVTVSVGKNTDGATEGTDYTTVNNFNITIPANAASARKAETPASVHARNRAAPAAPAPPESMPRPRPHAAGRNARSSSSNSSGASSGMKWPQSIARPRTSSARPRHTSIMSRLAPVCQPGRRGMLPAHRTRTGQASFRPRSARSCSRSSATAR